MTGGSKSNDIDCEEIILIGFAGGKSVALEIEFKAWSMDGKECIPMLSTLYKRSLSRMAIPSKRRVSIAPTKRNTDWR